MKSVVVLVTDHHYFHKAKRTILDVRSRGQWVGDIVLFTIGFDASRNFLDYYRIQAHRREHLPTDRVLEQYRTHPIRPTCDNREFTKLTQWDKFYAFDPLLSQWDRVVYLDAGLRVFDSISILLDVPCKGSLLAPDDAAPTDAHKRFGGIIETDRNPEVVSRLFQEFHPSILTERYFLNCIWMYDTQLLQRPCMSEMVRMMNDYPICRCNEMTIMNLYFTFKLGVWKPFPEWVSLPSGPKRLFGWTEHDRDYDRAGTWRDFCFLKYPFGITFDCE